jgi:hypothetical protein
MIRPERAGAHRRALGGSLTFVGLDALCQAARAWHWQAGSYSLFNFLLAMGHDSRRVDDTSSRPDCRRGFLPLTPAFSAPAATERVHTLHTTLPRHCHISILHAVHVNLM